MKKHSIIFTLALVMLLSFGAQALIPAQASEDTDGGKQTEAYTGWKTEDGSKYYYIDGKKAKGWQTIGGSKYYFAKNGKMSTYWKKVDGKYYYFGKNGKMRTNQIAGTDKKGYYYVDSDGIRIKDKTVKTTVSFVNANSKSSQTKGKRLKSCYNKMVKYSYIRSYGDKPTAKKMPSYADDLFKNKGGNCYRFATAMAYVGRVLGYDTRVAIGAIDSSNNGSFSAHSWCEIYIGGEWKIIDCTQTMHGRGSFFKVTESYYNNRNMTLRCDKRFQLTIKKGTVKWKKVS